MKWKRIRFDDKFSKSGSDLPLLVLVLLHFTNMFYNNLKSIQRFTWLWETLLKILRPIRDSNPWPSDFHNDSLKVWCSTDWANRAYEQLLLARVLQHRAQPYNLRQPQQRFQVAVCNVYFCQYLCNFLNNNSEYNANSLWTVQNVKRFSGTIIG